MGFDLFVCSPITLRQIALDLEPVCLLFSLEELPVWFEFIPITNYMRIRQMAFALCAASEPYTVCSFILARCIICKDSQNIT